VEKMADVKRKYITKSTHECIYAASRYLTLHAEQELGVIIPFHVYLQDPYVAENDPKFGIEELFVPWEPGIADGPTSARFAVVDFNADSEQLAPKAVWDAKKEQFFDIEGMVVNKGNIESLQFHQVNVWAIVQNALAFFEDGHALGRRIPFGFEGNRLILVPHAGYGKNAYYDRQSKSLQFYYFDEDNQRIYTCLSTDIVHHEFGHALLDGIRPYLMESVQVETAAFHEFFGDLTAIILILRNNTFRQRLAEAVQGDLDAAELLKGIAEQFGKAVSENEFLRTASDELKYSKIKENDGPHHRSKVLTGAMFDILKAISQHYIQCKDKTAAEAFNYARDRMQRTAFQPLDLLPPVDVTFRDYALAVLRSEELSNPKDPEGYFNIILDVFLKRDIFNSDDKDKLLERKYLYDRLDVDIFHDVDSISRSRAAAYRFLDDNRNALLIPPNQDVVVADLYDSNKLGRQGLRLPRQIILEYIWKEAVELDGERFGQFKGEWTDMLCGGTIVFNEIGIVLSWFYKAGTYCPEEILAKKNKGDKLFTRDKLWLEAREDGEKRKIAFLNNLEKRINNNEVGVEIGSSKGLLGSHIPPLIVHKEDENLRFELSPHLHLDGEDHEHYKGGSTWTISS